MTDNNYPLEVKVNGELTFLEWLSPEVIDTIRDYLKQYEIKGVN